MRTEKQIKFTKHAIQRARERKLWKFVNKKIVYFDAANLDFNKVIYDNCIYVLAQEAEITKVLTMYKI